MLKIPRVDTFLGFNLKISLLIFQHVGILIDIGSMIEFMIEVSASIELVAILFVFERKCLQLHTCNNSNLII